MTLFEQMRSRAQALPQKIVLPEGTEIRTLKAANQILVDGVAEIILIGDPAEIKAYYRPGFAAGIGIQRQRRLRIS